MEFKIYLEVFNKGNKIIFSIEAFKLAKIDYRVSYYFTQLQEILLNSQNFISGFQLNLVEAK